VHPRQGSTCKFNDVQGLSLQELPIGNTLDIMHVERNVLGNIFKYLFGDKDTIEVHKDLEKARAMQHLWVHQQGARSYTKP
jgi:hypothetical protein